MKLLYDADSIATKYKLKNRVNSRSKMLFKSILLVFFFKSAGTPPSINPIIQKQVCMLKDVNRNFSMFPNKIMPIKTPNIIGKRNFRFFFQSLKKFKIEFTNVSYIPNITQNTPLLIPW